MSALEERLLSRGVRNPETGCLEYSGSRDGLGYGRISYDKFKSKLVHRVAYGLWIGDPEGLVVMHTCDNPPCFEPTHLRGGTHKDNSQDMASKGRAGGQGVTHCPQGHEYVEGSWYGRPNARTCKQCAIARSKERWHGRKQ